MGLRSMASDQDPLLLTNRWAKEGTAKSVQRPFCHCLERQGGWRELKIHAEQQDTTCSAWMRLLELVEEAASDLREEFSPRREMQPEQWAQIVTLPPSIAKLKSIRRLNLYGSHLVRIPPEIGEMTSLEEFTPYTSYRLHWFPYEITRCANLKASTVSTRALYGNYKNRPPFPRLPQLHDTYTPASCSVCAAPFGGSTPLQYWVSLRVATDVLPLLVHACSADCLSKIPAAPKEYIDRPHQGGLGRKQPPTQAAMLSQR
jgi:hypothetical protein